MKADRSYDIVLFGATGFTGGLTAEYLAANAAPGTRWALAGRNPAKLEATRERLAEINPELRDLTLLHADSTDVASLEAIARASRIVVTTVGPYARHGEPLVAACAKAGTDYLDLTGEPTFVDQMYVRYHDEAVRSGARLVHACGFDSIPSDLGTLFTVQRLPEGVPLHVECFMRLNGRASGGTMHSAIAIVSDMRGMARAERERREAEPWPEDRRIRVSRRPVPRTRVSGWTLPMTTLDPQVVARSAAALDRYGPDFTYGQYLATRRFTSAAGVAAGMGAAVALAQLPPTRALLQRLAAAPGDGPSAEQQESHWFRATFVGEGGGEKVVTEVAGGDPGYGETAKMLAEAALCMAHDDLPDTAGQITTAVAMGDALIGRLRRAGITFRELDPPEPKG
jgi:short subunit dehydrogenase-like uncharacterized protein